MSGHTKGKLFVSSSTLIVTKDARIVADVTPISVPLLVIAPEESIENAKHLTRCWNSHDDLLTACKAAVYILKQNTDWAKKLQQQPWYNRAKQAIANAEKA